jgi:hypothetical protein
MQRRPRVQPWLRLVLPGVTLYCELCHSDLHDCSISDGRLVKSPKGLHHLRCNAVHFLQLGQVFFVIHLRDRTLGEIAASTASESPHARMAKGILRVRVACVFRRITDTSPAAAGRFIVPRLFAANNRTTINFVRHDEGDFWIGAGGRRLHFHVGEELVGREPRIKNDEDL